MMRRRRFWWRGVRTIATSAHRIGMPMSMPRSAPHGTTGHSVVRVGKMRERAKVITARTPTTRPAKTAVGIA